MNSLLQVQYTPHQNSSWEGSECDMNALAKRYNQETRRLTAGTGKSVLVTKRKSTSYFPIII